MACLGLFKNRPKKGAAERGPAKSSPPGSAAATRSGTNGSSVGRRTSPSRGSAPSPRSIPALFKERAHGLRVFNLDELRKATNDFNKMLKIGEGGFGSVYKGYIRRLDGQGDRMPVAIKRLNSKGLQGHKQWLAEVQFLGVVEHPNLVKLIGYCSTDGERGVQRLLVYEFMPNKSLEDHLFNPAYPALSWNLRLQIALGAAQGLAYLHEGLEVQVIYRDFKASNVLLDKEFKPKLSDFGLAREGPEEGRSHVTTAVVGTYGYAAPEYIETGHLTVKSDIWSFGVFLFEFLTGRRSFEPRRPSSEQKLLHWVRQFPVDSRKFSMIMDPRLRNGYSLAAAQEAAKLASSCLVKNPKDRPSMNEVVECLKRIIQMEVTKGVPSASTADKLRNTALQKTSTV